jgi:hypothetical protein
MANVPAAWPDSSSCRRQRKILLIAAERFTSGWEILLPYPRLYAAWLVWTTTVKELSKAKGL